MNLNCDNLARYFNDSAKNSKNVMANKYGAFGVDETLMLYEQVVREIREILEQPRNKSILDVGCGTGEILSRIASTCPEITGLDLSIEMVKMVERKGYSAQVYDGTRFPFSDNSQDIVLVYQVLINFPDSNVAKNLLREAVRVVRKGGSILVGAVPHPTRSAMPTHRLIQLKQLTIIWHQFISGVQSIPYYSYKYDFFCDLFDELELNSVEFLPCRIQIPSWQTKYHVLLVK